MIEKLPPDAAFDLAVRDGKTGFTFFNIEGHRYDYDPNAQSLSITGGNLLVSQEFANALGRPSDAGAIVGKISIGAAMQPIEIDQVVNGELRSMMMPALGQPAVGTQPGPDVIVGDLPEMAQYGHAGTQVGLAVGTDSCNRGTENVDWFALPNNDHPVVPQNMYRMSSAANNNDRFEQIGQSWLKHTFAAASSNTCGFGCNGVGGDHLGSGCSDLYSSGLNASQGGLGSRAWVNPFSGFFPSGNTLPMTTTATTTTAYPTGSGLRPVIWTRRSTLERSILWRANTSLRMNTRGARRIPGNATCTTMSPIVSLLLTEAQPISIFHSAGSTISNT